MATLTSILLVPLTELRLACNVTHIYWHKGGSFRGASGGLRQSGGPCCLTVSIDEYEVLEMTSILHGVVEELRSSTGFFFSEGKCYQYIIREPSLIQ